MYMNFFYKTNEICLKENECTVSTSEVVRHPDEATWASGLSEFSHDSSSLSPCPCLTTWALFQWKLFYLMTNYKYLFIPAINI